MIPAKENLKMLVVDLEKASDVLLYSVEKCRKISISEGLSYEELESYEALTSRFARLSDIIIQKVFRTIDSLDLDDAGKVRDRINRAEKKGLIKSADDFIAVRILRNEIAHEYKTETIYSIFLKVLELSEVLLESVDSICVYVDRHRVLSEN